MRWAKFVIALLIAAVWFAVIVRHNCEAVGSADSSGYFNEARLLGSGRLTVPVPGPLFIPLGFIAAPESGAMVPSYPAGYPLHLALFRFAPFYVTPVAALLCLVAMFALARTFGLSDESAFGASLMLATVPAFLLMSMQPMSDIVSLLWCMLAMLFALRERSVLAGIAFAIAVWVRPSNLLLAIPLGFSFSVGRRRLAAAILGALPFAIALVLLNHAMYGKWLTTGYGSIGYMLSWTNPITRAPLYARWLAIYLIGLLVIFDKRAGKRALLGVWFAVFFVFYSFFSPIGEWGYTRFLLPAIPPLIIGILLLLRTQRALATIVVVAIAFHGWRFAQHEHVFAVHERELIYPQTIAWAEQRLPRNATVAAMQLGGAFFYYANRVTFRYDLAEEYPHPLYAVIFGWELPYLRGHWTTLDRYRTALLMKLDDVPREVHPQNGAGDQR